MPWRWLFIGQQIVCKSFCLQVADSVRFLLVLVPHSLALLGIYLGFIIPSRRSSYNDLNEWDPSQTYNDDPLGSWWWGAAQKLCAEMNKRQSGGDEKRNNNCWGMAGVLLWEEEGGPVRRSHHNNKSHIIPNITMFGAHNKRGTAAATVLLRGSVMEVILADWMRCQRNTGRDSGVEQIWPAAAAPTMMKHNTFRKILGKELLARVEIVREKSEWWGEHQQYIKQCC